MGEPVIHWELSGSDVPALRKFYGALFDWKINSWDTPENTFLYSLIDTGGGGINGAIYKAEGPGRVRLYVQVDDLQAYLDRVEMLGGKTVTPPTPVPGIGSSALFSDPEGNVFGLFKT